MASKNTQNDKKTLLVRIVCAVLAVLMIGGVITATVLTARAEEEAPAYDKQVFLPDDYLIRCAISFRDDTLDSHRVRTHFGAPGFDLYVTTLQNELTYIWTLENNDVSVSETGNLRKNVTNASAGQWYYYADPSNTVAGGYHLQIKEEYDETDAIKEAMRNLANAAKSADIALYPAYVNGNYYIRSGAYTSSQSAESERVAVEAALGVECIVVSPTATSLTVLDYTSADVLFDFDMTDTEYGLGLHCLEYNGAPDQIKTAAGYRYDGVLEFRRYRSANVDGVTMILISELETYVICVVPWEIYTNWPAETMKAFAVCARTFVIANSHERAKHKAYGCDVCYSSDCQNCKGFERVSDSVIKCVNDSEGLILCCDGKPITTYYNSLGGGSITAAHEVWNMPAEKYLEGMMTPWENLNIAKYGHWEFTASPTELLEKVRAAGYTSLKGAVADVKINKLCENSTYVYSVTITDTYGTSVTINRCRNIRSAFSGLMYAANFKILHNGVLDDGINKAVKETVTGLYVMTGNGLKMIDGEERINVITDNGLKQKYLPERLVIKTSSSLISQKVQIKAVGSAGGSYDTSSDFTFIGSGNGHGVGASQWGSKDLGDLGYKFDQILYTYFVNTRVMDFNEYLDSNQK